MVLCGNFREIIKILVQNVVARRQISGKKCGRRSLKQGGCLMTNNSKNLRQGFKVVVENRWSLNSSGRKHDFDCMYL